MGACEIRFCFCLSIDRQPFEGTSGMALSWMRTWQTLFHVL